MADQNFDMEEYEEEVLEMDETLEKVLNYCVEEAKEKLAQVGSFAPFTAVIEGDNMHIESFPGEDIEAIRNNARDTVKTASSFATHYAFCYDGFIDTEGAGTLDAIIVECADRDMEESFAICQIYTVDEAGEGKLEFEDGLAYIGPGEMFFDENAVQAAEDKEFEEAQREMQMTQEQQKAAEWLAAHKAKSEEDSAK